MLYVLGKTSKSWPWMPDRGRIVSCALECAEISSAYWCDKVRESVACIKRWLADDSEDNCDRIIDREKTGGFNHSKPFDKKGATIASAFPAAMCAFALRCDESELWKVYSAVLSHPLLEKPESHYQTCADIVRKHFPSPSLETAGGS